MNQSTDDSEMKGPVAGHDVVELREAGLIIQVRKHDFTATWFMLGLKHSRTIPWNQVQGVALGKWQSSLSGSINFIYIGLPLGQHVEMRSDCSIERLAPIVALLQQELDAHSSAVQFHIDGAPCTHCHSLIFPGESMCAICGMLKRINFSFRVLLVMFATASLLVPVAVWGFTANLGPSPIICCVFVFFVISSVLINREAMRSVKLRRTPR
jgi:hypothetical protein